MKAEMIRRPLIAFSLSAVADSVIQRAAFLLSLDGLLPSDDSAALAPKVQSHDKALCAASSGQKYVHTSVRAIELPYLGLYQLKRTTLTGFGLVKGEKK
uniref:Secreted protein n=1 Tax=Steinernema glaseri TaxID=37863 RepID=A0A1I7Y9Z8_9BILA